MKKLCVSLIIQFMIVGFAIGQQSDVQSEPGRWENGVSEPWWFDDSLSKAEIGIVKSKWQAIGIELGSLSEGFAADYFEGGETHGTYFRWAPKAGFVILNVDKCAALVMDFSYGDVIAKRPFLNLVIKGRGKTTSSHTHHKSITTRFALVTWRSVPYLMAERDIKGFCDYLAGLGKFNSGLRGNWDLTLFPFFTGRGKETGTANDPPIVPPGYERLVKRPIDASIVRVGTRTVREFRVDYDDAPHHESRTQVTVNVGRAQGVKPGMKFLVLDSDDDDELVITRTGKARSSGILIRYVEENPTIHFSQWKDYDRYGPVKVGWKLSTSIHKFIDLRN